VWVSGADAAVALLQSVVGGGALTWYFTEIRGMNIDSAAVVWLIFMIWNSINDPLFGYISDRTKSKLGRRIPYIRFGAPIIATAFILLFVDFPGTQGQNTALFIQFLAGLFIYDTLYTAIATSIYIMPYEMAVSNKARSSVFIWKILFMTISTGVPLVVLPMIKPVPGVDDPSSFRWMMVGLGILAGLIVYFSTFFYKEKTFQQAEEQLPFFKAFVESFKNVPFIIFLVSSFTVIYCQTGLMQGVFYYFDNVPGVNAMYTYIALGVGIVAGVFFWVNMRERWGVKRCLQIWLFVFSLGCFIMLLMGKTQIGAILSFLCVGVGFAGGMYLIPIMNGDVIDYDETRTKLRREGMYAGINSFVSKPAISLAQAAFLSITASYGYVAGQPTPPEMMDQVSTGILTGWMLIPGILLAVSFVSMFFYPLFGKKWEQTKKELGMLHEKKERALLAKQGK
ncbi:MAG TPA: MFS transporter, partial [Anaerolineaceae bacterium]|nr:MFS transporter [Anaerolineaceae bacterium]